MDDKNKTTNQVAEVSAETLNKLASRDADVRQSGLIDIFEQHLPQIPKDYVLKNKDRKFVEDSLNVAFDLTGGIAYDASCSELRDMYTTVGENQGIPVKNWASFMGDRGGLQGAIQFAPLEPIANSFNVASAQLERIKGQIYEVEGISDIMRGQAMPYETATATTAKSQQAFGRFASRQQDVAEYQCR